MITIIGWINTNRQLYEKHLDELIALLKEPV
jgi:hypothetical protein